MSAENRRDGTLRHLDTAVRVSLVTIIALGIFYPLAMTGLARVLLPGQSAGSYVESSGRVVGSALIGQRFTQARYFHGRPSAAGKDGYDPTSTGATNLGPTSAKLMTSVAAAIKALRKENPDSPGPVPPDLVTTSASGIDPDISLAAALYQVPRVGKARRLSVERVSAIVREHVLQRDLGFLGEPRVNVLELNRALDSLGRH